MIFELGKELRALSVVEFVFFFVSLVQCSCEVEDGSSSCAEVEAQQDGASRPLDGALSGATLCSTALCSWSKIVALFGKAVYITVVALLFRDTRVCQSRTSNSALVIAVTCVGLKCMSIGLQQCVAAAFQKHSDRAQQEQEQVLEATSGWALGRISVLQRFSAHLRQLVVGRGDVDNARRPVWVKRFGVCVVVLYALLWVALAVFSFSTDVKLAIPGSYEAPCDVNSEVSRFLVLAFPCVALVFGAVEIACTLGWWLVVQSLWSMRVVMEIWVLVQSALGSILGMILFARVFKVWRGHELELFEHVALVVGYPFFRNT